MRGAGAVVDVAEGGKFARKGFGGVDGVGDLVVGEGIGVAGGESEVGDVVEEVGDDAAEGAGVGEFRAGVHVPDENGVEDAVEVLADIGPRIHFDELADVGEGAVAEVVEEGALAVGFRVSFEV